MADGLSVRQIPVVFSRGTPGLQEPMAGPTRTSGASGVEGGGKGPRKHTLPLRGVRIGQHKKQGSGAGRKPAYGEAVDS